MIRRVVLAQRGDDPERDSDQQGNQERDRDKLDRGAEPLKHLFGHRQTSLE
jgi:hypothetical protein